MLLCRYNFMPLARGSAVVGAMTVLAVFMAAGMPITASIPPVSRSLDMSPRRSQFSQQSKDIQVPTRCLTSAGPPSWQVCDICRSTCAGVPDGLGGHPVAVGGPVRGVGVAVAVPARGARQGGRRRPPLCAA
jgi:hypothetical protein